MVRSIGQPKIYEDNLQLNLKFCLDTKSAGLICLFVFTSKTENGRWQTKKHNFFLLTEHVKLENLPHSKLPIQFNKNVQKQSGGTMYDY